MTTTKEIEKSNIDAEILMEKAQMFRMKTFEMIHKRGNGHWGGSSSATELLTALYYTFLSINPEDPKSNTRDRLILSKGHAAPVLYQILSELGFFPKEYLSEFRSLGSMLQGHPCMSRTPGVEMSTGPLGHGVSVGVGMALASKLQKVNNKTVVLIGDGDINEGETWEGFMAAAKYKPEGLIFLVDYNKVQLDGKSDDIMPMDPLKDKLKAFGINVCEKEYNGHDIYEIFSSFDWIKLQNSWPVAVVYNTIKGKGISFTENNYKWHGAPIDKESFELGYKELKANYDKILLDEK
jgi:transketolase